MAYKNKRLQIRQIDDQLKKFKSVISDIPSRGWIHTLRTTLGMSLAQLGEKLGTSPQAVLNLEKREVDMSITLGKLKKSAEAMGFRLVYVLIPEKSIEEMIETKSRELATQVVMATSKQMTMEDQKISSQRLKEAINERTEEIKRTLPKILWD